MAWTPPTPGELRERVRFERRIEQDDGHGNDQAGWVPACPDRRVRLLPERGGEAVTASRLAGRSAWVLDVPADSVLRTIDADCRVVDSRDETRVWNIRSVLDLEGRDRWRTMTLEMGVAV